MTYPWQPMIILLKPWVSEKNLVFPNPWRTRDRPMILPWQPVKNTRVKTSIRITMPMMFLKNIFGVSDGRTLSNSPTLSGKKFTSRMLFAIQVCGNARTESESFRHEVQKHATCVTFRSLDCNFEFKFEALWSQDWNLYQKPAAYIWCSHFPSSAWVPI